MPDAPLENIKVETRDLSEGVWELLIEGSLDWSNFSKVENAIEDLFRRGLYRVVVNLKGCRYISSAGFGCFISSLDTAMKNNGDLVFAATPVEIHDVFNILGLGKILRFSDTPESARELFRK
jgi:anti-anti-sigma factor